MNPDQKNKFNYQWKLSNGYPAPGIENHKKKVFSFFACGGGSTMGYKLAGYDVIGMNEIDPKMAECYIKNHNPKYSFVEPIQEFKNRKDLPKELYELDILDGSPPCSSFSIAGNRNKDWGKKKKFREGQAEQVLDTLFFDFIDVAEKLKPKVVIAENVKGLILGEAKAYVNKIYNSFDKAGYYVSHILLNASTMGVPQKRERVFFYAIRKDLLKYIETADLFGNEPELILDFKYKKIIYENFKSIHHDKKVTSQYEIKCVKKCTASGVPQTNKPCLNGKIGAIGFGNVLINKNVPNTMTTGYVINKEKMCYATNEELCYIGSFPQDYNFNKNKPGYLIGMSVPPVMMAQISYEIYKQWLSRIKT